MRPVSSVTIQQMVCAAIQDTFDMVGDARRHGLQINATAPVHELPLLKEL